MSGLEIKKPAGNIQNTSRSKKSDQLSRLSPATLQKVAQGAGGISKKAILQEIDATLAQLKKTEAALSPSETKKEEHREALHDSLTKLEEGITLVEQGMSAREKGFMAKLNLFRWIRHRNLRKKIGPIKMELRLRRMALERGGLTPELLSEALPGKIRIPKEMISAPHTILRGTQGQAFELLNSVSHSEAEEGNIQEGKHIVLGKGSFGKVRYARDLATGEIMAVKKIIGEESIEECFAEVESHQAISEAGAEGAVPLYDAVRTQNKKGEDTLYLFMPLSRSGDGLSLLETLFPESGPDPGTDPQQLAMAKKGYILQTASAVSDLHRSGYAHLDLKPDNQLCFSDGTLQFCDFGLAKEIDTSLTEACGTPLYVAPEILALRQSLTKSINPEMADAYSLGLMLLEASTGHHPLLDLKNAHFFKPEHRKAAIEAELTVLSKHSRGLANVLRQLLEENPKKRRNAEWAAQKLTKHFCPPGGPTLADYKAAIQHFLPK